MKATRLLLVLVFLWGCGSDDGPLAPTVDMSMADVSTADASEDATADSAVDKPDMGESDAASVDMADVGESEDASVDMADMGDSEDASVDMADDAAVDMAADMAGDMSDDVAVDMAEDMSGDMADPDMGADMEVDAGPNEAPIANAGADQTGILVRDVVFLSAGFSTDPDGDALTYVWSQTSGAPVVLLDPNQIATSFTAVRPAGDYEFMVTVSDGRASSQDSVKITVDNRLPTANAGIDQAVSAGALVALDGSQSVDDDGDSITYSWVQTGGPSVTMVGSTTAAPTFAAPIFAGDLTFSLTVNDGLDSAVDSTKVTVTNLAPVAEAGANQVVGAGDLVTLNGSGTDPEGQSLTYAWTQVSGPATVVLSNAAAPAPTFTTALGVAGVYVFELVVHDGVSASAPDRTNVEVPNSPPVADAGADALVNGGELVILDGRGSVDVDGDAFDYEWTQTSGTPVDFGNGDRARAYFKAPSAVNETLTFQLKVSNQQGVDVDSVSFTKVAWAGTEADIPENPYAATLEPFTNSLFAIAASGDTMVAGGIGGQHFAVYDFTDPANPVRTATANTTGAPGFLQLDGTTVFAGVGAVIEILNYSGTSLDYVGSVSLPASFLQIMSMGRDGDTLYAAILDPYSGLYAIAAFDIQNMPTPSLLHYEVVQGARTVAVRSNELWVGGNNSLVAYDTSSIRGATPAFVPLTDAADARCDSVPRAMQIVGNLLYAACNTWADIAIFDITTPADPVLLSQLNVPGVGEGIVVDGTKAYVASNTNGVLVFDVSVPAAPVYLGNLPTSGTTYSLAFLSASQRVVAKSGNIIDILEATPRTPEFASSIAFASDLRTLDFDSGLLGVYSSYIDLLDIRDTANITTESTINEYAFYDIEVAYPLLFASNGNEVSIVDITVPSSPLTLATIGGNLRYDEVVYADDILYIAAETSGVLIYDVSNPSAPTLLGTFSTGDHYVGALIDGTTLYASAFNDGVHVLDVSTPATPTEIGYWSFTSPRGRMSKSGDYVWSGLGANTIRRYDVSDPANPVGATLNLYNPVQQIRVNGAMAWIATGAGGLMTVDVSDVANPVVLERYGVEAESNAIVVGDEQVWFTDGPDLRGILLDNAQWLARFQTGTTATTLAYPIAWEQPAADATVQCFVSGGTCTVGSLDLVNRTATLSWTLPAPGDHEIAVVVGHQATRSYLRDRVKVTP